MNTIRCLQVGVQTGVVINKCDRKGRGQLANKIVTQCKENENIKSGGHNMAEYCAKCGNKLNSSDAFCPVCGAGSNDSETTVNNSYNTQEEKTKVWNHLPVMLSIFATLGIIGFLIFSVG